MKTGLKLIVTLFFAAAITVPFAFRAPSNVSAEQPVPTPVTTQRTAPLRVKLECNSCHGAGSTLPKLGPGERFHRDAHREYEGSIHARIQENGKPAAVCIDCHTVDGDMTTDFPPDDPRSTVYATKQEQTCGKCHQGEYDSFHLSIHGKLLDKGDTRAASCSDCHGRHTIQSSKTGDAAVMRVNIANVCIKCHSGIVPEWENSSHGIAFKRGDPKAPMCTDCHSAVSHHEAPADIREFSLLMVDTCSSCHQQQAPSYRDTFHGQATEFKYQLAATCADCHTPHHNLPASNPASSVHPANLIQTCATCHTGVNAGFVTFQPHPEPKNPEKGYMTYVVATFMKWLLLCVFGFFGVHTVLWLQRSIVAAIKGETHKRVRDEEEKWVLRFSRQHRLTHVAIIVSFLGLAATGLPLMYSFTDWGKWVVEMHGGLAVTRFIHRVCAIITFGYAGYHLWFVLKKAFVERDKRAFFGPETMMIRKQDFIDAFNMFRWFFYLGPRPKLDRFTYWEKFDYFAVFWGVPVIGISGLMLWFPTFFTRFLPGEALNIATIVHGEEALLATAFIFSFHFFHNHLRPENFPMDIVMFTGKVRLSWFKDERPVEYARLVEEGKLEDVLVPPPSKSFRAVARVFGFAAYITGLLLVMAIFVTLFTVKH